MDTKIQELTDKIYKEGVEKGNEEAGRIIDPLPFPQLPRMSQSALPYVLHPLFPRPETHIPSAALQSAGWAGLEIFDLSLSL